MMRRVDPARNAQEQTSRVWDAVARGAPPDIDILDPTLLETIRRLQALGQQPRPDPEFADRLEATLMRSASTPALAHLQSPHPLTTDPNGRGALPAPPPAASWQAASRFPRRWPALASAALVLLTLIGTLATINGPLSFEHDETLSIPALEGTRFAGILLQATFEEIPPAAVFLDVERTVLAPGATWALGEHLQNGEGPQMYRVESGALTIEPDSPIAVTRSGEQIPTTVQAETDVILTAGDAGYTPSGITSRWRNDGATPASVLQASITTSEFGTSPHGVEREPLIEQVAKTPPGPAVMTVRRLRLEVGENFIPGQVEGLQGLYVEQGSLDMFAGTDAGATLIGVLPAGSSRTVGGRGHHPIPVDWRLRNAGPKPVTLLIVVVNAANPLGNALMN
jgi:hypothetical protein